VLATDNTDNTDKRVLATDNTDNTEKRVLATDNTDNTDSGQCMDRSMLVQGTSPYSSTARDAAA
jgi:hypothetical protein